MQTQTHATAAHQKKMRLLLPLIALPFCALLFYALGGGKGAPDTEGQGPQGLNTNLPAPKLDDRRPQDKLSLYKQAAKDSLAQHKKMAFDPFRRFDNPEDANLPDDPEMEYPAAAVPSTFSKTYRRSGNDPPADPAREVEQKLKALEKLLEAPPPDDPRATGYRVPKDRADSELRQLEDIMADLGEGAQQPDPELERMDGMLSKILDIQHPERVRERARDLSLENKGQVFAVATEPHRPQSDLLTADSSQRPASDGPQPPVSFYELDMPVPPTVQAPTIAALVHETQTLVSGATLKLRLLQDAYVQGICIPKGTFLHGRCNLSGERLQVSISAIRHEHLLLPVSLQAFDMDGIAGIRIPGSINRESAKQGADQAIQAISMASLDPSLTAQAASAGIETAKNLLSKKVKLVRVTVKADYPLLLMGSNTTLY